MGITPSACRLIASLPLRLPSQRSIDIGVHGFANNLGFVSLVIGGAEVAQLGVEFIAKIEPESLAFAPRHDGFGTEVYTGVHLI